jgi:hypothetical protein
MAPPNAQRQADLPAFILQLVRSMGQAKLANNTAHIFDNWDANRPQRVAELRRYANHQMQLNLGSWRNEIGDAIGTAALPIRPESRIFWYIALAGNLLWAATCFINPAAAGAAASARYLSQRRIVYRDLAKDAKAIGEAAEKTRTEVIQLMSVSGAAIGSGSAEELAKKFPHRDLASLHPEDGKDYVRDVVGRRRAHLEDIYKQRLERWALELDGIAMWEAAASDQEPLGIYDQYIWEQMFPRVPYDENRYNTIRHEAQAIVEGALVDYDQQWQRWVTAPMMPQYHQAEAQWAMGTLAQVPKNKPFRPDLKFKLDF